MKKIITIITLFASITFASDLCQHAAQMMISYIPDNCKTIEKNMWFCSDKTKENGGTEVVVTYKRGNFDITRTYVPPIELKRLGHRNQTTSLTIYSDFCYYHDSKNHNSFQESHNNISLAQYYKDIFVEDNIKE